MNERKRASGWAIALSVALCVAGAFVLLLVCQAFYAALVLHMRVFFPFILSPIMAAVGLWWVLTPLITIRNHGRGALINLAWAAITAGVVFSWFFLLLMLTVIGLK